MIAFQQIRGFCRLDLSHFGTFSACAKLSSDTSSDTQNASCSVDESSLTGETTTANKDEIAMTFYETEVLPFTALLPFVDDNVNRVSHSLLTSPELVHQCIRKHSGHVSDS